MNAHPETPHDVLIACAFQRELDPLQTRLKHRTSFLATGLGQKRTSATLQNYLSRHSPKLLIFSGTAGQLDPSLPQGEVVAPMMWKLEDGRAFYADAPTWNRLHEAGWYHHQSGLTVRRPVIRPGRRLELWRLYQACICDMESAAVLKLAGETQVPAISIKVVSDTADSGLLDFWRSLEGNLAKLAHKLEQALEQLGF